jgi:regulation of enolase protein 1 (concanavalin A-like superfamily)
MGVHDLLQGFAFFNKFKNIEEWSNHLTLKYEKWTDYWKENFSSNEDSTQEGLHVQHKLG